MLDDLDQFLPGSVEDQQIPQIDPQYGGATKSNSLDEYKKFLEEMGRKSREDSEAQKRRMALLEKEVGKSANDRAAEIFNKMNKGRYGFTPDSKGKHVAAEVIDSIMGRLGFGMSQQAYKLGEQDYDNKTKGYKDLLSGELANQNAINKQNQFDLAEKLRVVQQEEKERAQKEKEAQVKRNADLNDKKFDLQKTIGQHKMLYDEVQMAAKSTDTYVKKYAQDKLEELDKINPMLSDIMKMKPEMMAIALPMMIKKGKISVDDVNNSFKYLNERTKATTKQSDTSLGSVSTPSIAGYDQFNNAIPGPTTRMKIPGKSQAPYEPGFKLTPDSLTQPIMDKVLGPRNPLAEITDTAKPLPQAQRIAKDVLSPESSLQTNDIFTNPMSLDKMKGRPGDLAKRADEFKTWTSLNDRQRQLYESSASDYAQGKLTNWQGPIPQNSIVQGIRKMTGKSEQEIQAETQSALLALEHLKARSGIRAQKGLEDFKKVLEDKLDSPDAYMKRLATQKLLIEMGHLEKNDAIRYEKLIGSYNKKYDANPVKGGSLGEAVNDVIEDALKKTKGKGKVAVPNFQQAYELGMSRLNGKSLTPKTDDLMDFIRNNSK